MLIIIKKKQFPKSKSFSTPGGNSISACELTCTLLGTLARPVVPAVASMIAGRWDRKLYSGNELYGKTLAILGLGRIGREVAIRMNAWGMRVIGFDPITTDAEAKAAGIEKMELAEIWPLADYITVHTPLIPSTRSEIIFIIEMPTVSYRIIFFPVYI